MKINGKKIKIAKFPDYSSPIGKYWNVNDIQQFIDSIESEVSILKVEYLENGDMGDKAVHIWYIEKDLDISR